MTTALLACDSLTVEVGAKTLVRDLRLSLPAGARVALLGPNGVGKTLSLLTLAGLRSAPPDTVRVAGADLATLSRRELALQLGLLLQVHENPFPTTVLEAALMGRYARLSTWRWEGVAERDLARQALRSLDLLAMEHRMTDTLSGGEMRRLGLATLLVQDPQILLLDEPMNHLDPLHQFAVLELLTGLAGRGRVIVASLHDPALVARSFEFCLMLFGDGRWRFGPVDQLLTVENLAELYQVPYSRFRGERETVLLPDWGGGAKSVALKKIATI